MNDAHTTSSGRRSPVELENWHYVRISGTSEPLCILPTKAECEAWAVLNRRAGLVVESIVKLIMYPGPR